MADASLPASSYAEAAAHLRRPFAPSAVKWKVQSTLTKDRGLLVCYVDARLVADRLDAVCGAENWSSELREFGSSGDVCCSLTVFGVTKEDIGKGGFAKASASDALKRAAVLHGVGRPLYASPTIVLESSESGGQVGQKMTLRRAKNRKGETVLYINDDAKAWLAARYREWVESPDVVVRFGDAFDHGDASESIGDAAVEGVELEPESPELEAERGEIAELYQAKTKGKTALRRKLPAAQFKAQLEGAESAEELAALREKVEGLE